MKFKIKRELLLEALNKVSKAISTKNLIPVLAGIKFEIISPHYEEDIQNLQFLLKDRR